MGATSALAMPAPSLASSLASDAEILPETFSTCAPSPEGASSCSDRSAGRELRRNSATAGGVLICASRVSTSGALAPILIVPLPESSGFVSVPNAVSLPSNEAPPKSSAALP